MPDPVAEVVRFGSFELDLDRVELRRTDGKAAVIQARPLEALVLLARNQGRIVDRETLQEHLWGSEGTEHDPATLDRSLNHCIRKLRQALNDRAREPIYIQTVQGQGYRFLPTTETPNGQLARPTTSDQRAVAIGRVEGPVTLAVGAFRDLGTDPSGPALSEGVAEELLGELVPLRDQGVSVVDGTGARPADDAGVFRLRGSVRRSESRVRVHAHLVRARDDTVVGTIRFDLPLGALFELQQRIARRIVETLVRPMLDIAEATA